MIIFMFGVSVVVFYYGYIEYYIVVVMVVIFYLINYVIFKGSLFMVVGIIDYEIGIWDVWKFGGLMVIMLIIFMIFLIGIFLMVGFLLFNGFLSKEMFFISMFCVIYFDLFNV